MYIAFQTPLIWSPSQAPCQFDDELVLRQLRYTGMVETVKIRKAGYSVRMTFEVCLPTHCTGMVSIHCTLYSLYRYGQHTLYTVLTVQVWSAYTVHCTHCTGMVSIHCTLYSLYRYGQHTLYTVLTVQVWSAYTVLTVQEV